MRERCHISAQLGSASLELVLAVGFLLIPAAALLAQLPQWVGTTHTAQVAATEAARTVVLADDMANGAAAAEQMVGQVIVNYGLHPEDLIDVEVTAVPPGELQRGQLVTVTVTLRGAPIVVPGVGVVGNPFDAVGSAAERVDDYRGFAP